MKRTRVMTAFVLLLGLSAVVGLGAVHAAQAVKKPGKISIQPGDLVTARLTATLEDGGVIFSTETLPDTARKTPGYTELTCRVPLAIRAGEIGPVPGLQEVFNGLGTGDKRRVTVPAEKAYGSHDPAKVDMFDATRSEPRVIEMGPQEYAGRFNSFPVVGAEVQANPFYPARVTAVGKDKVTLEQRPTDGSVTDGPFGQTAVRIKGETIELTLSPTIGADFEVNGEKGRIVSGDAKTFSVDRNHPLAGHAIVLDIEVLSVMGVDEMQRLFIPWLTTYPDAVEITKKAGKPCVLVLYAGWCQYSQKLLEETLFDARIMAMRDRFVWAKVDSDKDRAVKERYAQKSFPLTLVLDPDGTVIRRISGYVDAVRLWQELEAATTCRGTAAPSPDRPEGEPAAGQCPSEN